MAAQTTALQQPPADNSFGRRMRNILIGFTLFSVVLVGGLVAVAVFAVGSDGFAAVVEVTRNMLIIFVALGMLLAWTAFTLMLVQFARLANLVQAEMKPIVASSAEAVDTIRGTAKFVSQTVTEPIMQVNAAAAGAKQAFDLMRDFNYLRDLATAAAASGSKGNSGNTPSKAAETADDG